jgi:hypothetical protein
VVVAEHIHVADAPDRERYELSLDGEVLVSRPTAHGRA